jgi:hypothetical protein
LQALRQRDGAIGSWTDKFKEDLAELNGQLGSRELLPNLLVLGTYNNDVVVKDLSRKRQYGVLRNDHGLLREEDLSSAPPITTESSGDKTLNVRQEASPSLYSDPTNPLKDIDPDKVVQGDFSGDCRLAAKLSALAKEDPNAVARMINDNKDGTYTVTFPGDADHPVTVSAPNTWERETFTGTGGASWFSVIEKAYRQRMDEPMGPLPSTNASERERTSVNGLLTGKDHELLYQYYQLQSCGSGMLKIDTEDIKEHPEKMPLCPESISTRNLSSLMSAYPGHAIAISSQEDLHKRLLEIEQSHMLITAATSLPADKDLPTVIDRSGNKILLEPHHAYTITNYDPASRVVTLRNPWGTNSSSEHPENFVGDGYINMPLEQFEKFFAGFFVVEKTAHSQ